jgi:hypothetical protein
MTSSAAAIAYGRGARDAPFTEADWSDETNLSDTGAYERSRTMAERAAWAWLTAEGGALELATVNPGSGGSYWMKDNAAMLKQGLGDKGRKVPTLVAPDFAVRLIALFDPVVRGRL